MIDKILTTGLIGMEVQEEQVTLIATVPVTNLVVPTTPPIETAKHKLTETKGLCLIHYQVRNTIPNEFNIR